MVEKRQEAVELGGVEETGPPFEPQEERAKIVDFGRARGFTAKLERFPLGDPLLREPDRVGSEVGSQRPDMFLPRDGEGPPE